MNAEDYGLTPDVMATVEAAGAALTPERKHKPRVTTLAAAQKALEAGQAIPFVLLGSEANPHQNDKAWSLWSLYAEQDYKGLENYEVKGTNTYARLLSSYRGILMASVAAAVEPSEAEVAEATATWNLYFDERKAARLAARQERKTAKPAKAEPEEPRPYADAEQFPTAELQSKATELEAKASAERKTAARDELNAWRADAKAIRKELAKRLTPADKAAAKAVAADPKAMAAALPPKKAPAKPKAEPKAKAEPKPAKAPAKPKATAKKEPVKVPPKPKATEETAKLIARTAPKAKAKPEPKPEAEVPGAIETKVEVFTTKAAAVKAARAAIGEDAAEGFDFSVAGKGKRFSWVAITG